MSKKENEDMQMRRKEEMMGDKRAVMITNNNVINKGGDNYSEVRGGDVNVHDTAQDRKSTRLNSSHGYISYAVFCLKKKKKQYKKKYKKKTKTKHRPNVDLKCLLTRLQLMTKQKHISSTLYFT